MVPTVTFPKPIEPGKTDTCNVAPVPERATELAELEALLVMERLPVAFPPTVGAKLALRLVCSPAPSVKGSVSPLKLNPLPVTEAADTVTAPVPAFVRVTVWVLVAPTFTFPKASVKGETESWSVTPVPDSETTAGELEALLTTEMLPVAVPLVPGAKVALKPALWPPASVRGSVRPLMLKPEPVTVA